MNNLFIKRLKASELWDYDYKDMDDFIDNGLMKNDVIPELVKLTVNTVRTGDLVKATGDKYLGRIGLSIAQKNVLEALYFSKEEYLTQRKLSKFVYTSKSNMSSLLERMQKKDLLKEVEILKQKEKKVRLTKQGEEVYMNLISSMQDFKENIFCDIISKEEIEITNKVLLKLREFHKKF